jgi:hypothetical protein
MLLYFFCCAHEADFCLFALGSRRAFYASEQSDFSFPLPD